MTQKPMMFMSRSEALTSFLKQSPPREQRAAIAMHDDYAKRLKQAAAENPDNPEGIAAGAHDFVDQAIAHSLTQKHGDEVKCRRGCSACCRMHVDVTAGEAKLAVMAAESAGWSIDIERAKMQASTSGLDEWGKLSSDERACVFLTPAGECAIYEYRPMACRKYMVVSDPADCDSVTKPGHRVAVLFSPEAEIAYSATLSVLRFGTMAKMLLAELAPA